MTQALLSNFNSVNNDNISGCADAVLKSPNKDFSKILDTKSANINSYEENKVIAEDNSIVDDSVLDAKDIKVLTLGELKKTPMQEAISTEIDNALQEASVEAIVDLTVLEENIADNTENIDELNPEEETQNTQNTGTITEEDPTMNNEIIALNEPTIPIMLNIQQFARIPIDKEDAELNSDNLENSGNMPNNFNTNATELKQFEVISTKDTVNNSLLQTNDLKTKHGNPKLEKVLDEKVVKDLNIESINQEMTQNESSSENLMQNQTPQEQAVKAIIQSDTKYEDVSIRIEKTVNFKPVDISPNKIIEQISKQLERMYNSSKLNIVLNPEKLGKVNLQILNSRDGLTAQFTVTTNEAKDLLMKGLQGLKDNLLAHGINADSISVKLEETESEYQQDWTEQENSNGKFRHQNSKKQKEKEEKPFEQMMFEIENDDNLV